MILDFIPSGEMLSAFNHTEGIQEQLTAAVPTYIHILSRQEWDQFVENFPKIHAKINRILAERVARLTRKVLHLHFNDAQERINAVLHELAEQHGRKIGVGFQTEISLDLTHEDLGKMAAVSRQTVSTVLKQLRDQGKIDYNRRRILINNHSFNHLCCTGS